MAHVWVTASPSTSQEDFRAAADESSSCHASSRHTALHSRWTPHFISQQLRVLGFLLLQRNTMMKKRVGEERVYVAHASTL